MAGSDVREQAVVVGAAGSLAGAVAQRLLARGIEVIGVGRDEAKLAALADADPLFRACPADIADDASIDTIRAAITAPVRMAFMGAGLPVRGSADTIEPGMVAVGMNVKVGGMLRLVRATRDSFAPGARIVALSGYLGEEPNGDELGPGVVNAALANLMRQLAHLYGPKGVTVHTIQPGPVDTPRLRNIAKVRADERGKTVEEFLAEYVSESSLGRLVEIDQIVWMAEQLLAPEADALHGSVLAADGGRRRGIF